MAGSADILHLAPPTQLPIHSWLQVVDSRAVIKQKSSSLKPEVCLPLDYTVTLLLRLHACAPYPLPL